MFFGYIVLLKGIKIDLVKIKVVDDWKCFINKFELWSFLGLVLYYCIKDFVKIVKCLYVLISKYEKWEWILECDKVFECFKEKLVMVFILGYLDVNGGMLVLDIDVSYYLIGVVLL